MNVFQQFVENNLRWFRGRSPETDESLDAAEKSLRIQLPQDIRWLLREYGYWHATGISSLEETIADTQDAQEHLKLPERFVVLYNHQDGGVVLLDTDANPQTGENKVYNVGWEAVPDEIEQEIVYNSYLEYVRHVLDIERDSIAEEYIDYDPSLYSDL